MDFSIDMALSLLTDFDNHLRGRFVNKSAEDNLEVCARLVKSEDAQKIFNPIFLKILNKAIELRRGELIKEAETKLQFMKRSL